MIVDNGQAGFSFAAPTAYGSSLASLYEPWLNRLKERRLRGSKEVLHAISSHALGRRVNA
jgi:hypothetical protein